MPVSIPENITVHLGPPSSNAANITVPFADYVKNVASSEIYPTWPEAAIRANIYAQMSYVLNRIFTEWYRSQGYDFDITNSTRYDQSFVAGRDIFENISTIVDDMIGSYLTRGDAVEPLFAQYCNGTTVTCPGGLSQWGTVPLAEQGLSAEEIVRSFYGDDINFSTDAPLSPSLGESFPASRCGLARTARMCAPSRTASTAFRPTTRTFRRSTPPTACSTPTPRPLSVRSSASST